MIAEDIGGRVVRRHLLLAVSLWILTVTVTTLYLYVSSLDGALSPHVTDVYTGIAVLCVATAGAVLAWRRPRNPIGWLFLLLAPLVAMAAGSADYAAYALAVRHGGAPLGRFALWVSVWAWVPALGLAFMVIPLLIPDGRLPSPAWRPYLWFVIVIGTAYAAVNMVAPITADNYGLPAVANPYGIAWLQPVLGPLLSVGDFVALLFALASGASLLVRWRRADVVERRRLAWLVVGAAPLLVYAAAVLSDSWLPGTARAVDPAFALAVAAVPAATAVGVLRPQLMDAELVVRRAALIVALVLALGAVYGVVALVMRAVLPSHPTPLALVLPTLAMAAAVAPVRRLRLRRRARAATGEPAETGRPALVLLQGGREQVASSAVRRDETEQRSEEQGKKAA